MIVDTTLGWGSCVSRLYLKDGSEFSSLVFVDGGIFFHPNFPFVHFNDFATCSLLELACTRLQDSEQPRPTHFFKGKALGTRLDSEDNGSKKSGKNRGRAGKSARAFFTSRSLFSLVYTDRELGKGYVRISSRFPKINFIEVVLLIDPNLFKMGFLLFFRKLDDDKRNI